MASVRFICGAQTLHRALEERIAEWLGKDDAILFAACFDANGGLFEPLLGAEDAIISDALNHASIIDGIRLCKAKRYRFANSDMNELEERLKEADRDGARFKLIATDGVFSMDGYVAKLPEICDLAERYGAFVMVDDCHAHGHLGEKRPRHAGADRRGRARADRHRHARQDARRRHGRLRGRAAARHRHAAPAGAPLSLLQLARAPARRRRAEGDRHRRGRRRPPRASDARSSQPLPHRAGGRRASSCLPGETPIIPVMLHEAKLAQDMAAALDRRGIYVAGFFFPVVPKGKARIRTQMSAALSEADVDFAIGAFRDAGRELGIARLNLQALTL